MKKLNIAIACAGAAQALGALLPFMSASILGMVTSVSLTDGIDGWFFIGLAVAGIVFAVLDVLPSSCVTGAVCLAMTLYKDLSARSAMDTASSIMQHAVGYYLLLIGAAVMIGCSLYGMLRSRKVG